MCRAARSLAVLVALLFLSAAALAATAPVTPTYVMAWGNLGAAPGQFSSPADAAADAVGNVYVADANNNRIQKFDRLGNLILQWGSLGAENGQLDQPWSVTTDANGDVYVADTHNNRIQKFTSTGVYLTKWGSLGAGAGQFYWPEGVATDAAGDVYVADNGNHRVEKFTSSGVYLTQWGSNGSGNGQFIWPVGIATDRDGNVYVADQANFRIQKFSGSGLYLLQWGSSGSGDGQFANAYGVATDLVGNVYVADTYNHRIQMFDGAGVFRTKWGSAGPNTGQFAAPHGLAVDAAGNVYVADTDNHRIQKFSGAGVGLSEPEATPILSWGSGGDGDGQFSDPQGVAADAGGNVYVADYNNNRIQKFNGTGVYITQWGQSGLGNGQFDRPRGVAVDAAGDVYVVDTHNHRIQKFTSTGVYIAQWGQTDHHPGNGDGGFAFPAGVAVDATGNVYVADCWNDRIEKFTSTGVYTTQWGSGGSSDGQFINPNGVAVDAAGNVYVADTGNHRIQKFTSMGGYITKWGSSGFGNGQFSNPVGMTVDLVGNVYAADTGNHRIQKFTSAGVYLSQCGAVGPSFLDVDASGNIYSSAGLDNAIEKFAAPPAVALVSDVANDQGRQVRLRILRSSADAPGSGATVLRYDIFRRIDPLAKAGGERLDGWSQVGSISAYGDAEYNVVVPTLANATAASVEYSGFLVRAATADPYTYFDSGAEDGYSVDNLSPPAPSGFRGDYVAGGMHLHWDVCSAPDFSEFRLYRGPTADFAPDPASLIAAVTDTGYVDVAAPGSYYKLSAADVDGNESDYALVNAGTTSVGPTEASVALSLEGTPNPAIGGRMIVRFALPRGEVATLAVFDLSGRRIMTRAVGSLGAGRHSVNLAEGHRMAAGMYFVRLQQGAEQRTVRMLVVD